jgi:tRNA(Ile)-lysidine synthase
MNLLRGAGSRGASGMQAEGRIGRTRVVRPLLGTTREQIVAYAKKHRLEWIEDESNANEALTRNFIRRSVGPLLEARFPQWKKSLARAAKLFARKENRAQEMLRTYLRARGMKAPSEAKLVEMLKQLSSRGTRTLIEHDGARLRVYRGRVVEENPAPLPARMEWKGEPELALPGGQLRFRRVKGRGIDPALAPLTVRARSGGERLQLDPKRPRRTLKNLFQEAGVPPWERERLPLLYRGDDLVWAPGLGIDVRFRAGPGRSGVLPEWKPRITP